MERNGWLHIQKEKDGNIFSVSDNRPVRPVDGGNASHRKVEGRDALADFLVHEYRIMQEKLSDIFHHLDTEGEFHEPLEFPDERLSHNAKV